MTRLVRTFVRFRDNPSSLRYATAAIISTIVVLVLAGSVLIRLLAPDDYPGFGDAVWFTLQTVTTVGYGDNVPTSPNGRIVASVVMLVSIGLFTVITAAVTSVFITAVRREQEETDQRDTGNSLARIEAAVAATHERLDRIEADPAQRTGRDTTEGGDVRT